MRYFFYMFLILCTVPTLAQINKDLNSTSKIDSIYNLLQAEIKINRSKIRNLNNNEIGLEDKLLSQIAENRLNSTIKFDSIYNLLHTEYELNKAEFKTSDTSKIDLENELLTYKAKEDYFIAALDEQATRFALIITGLLVFAGLISFGWYQNEKRLINKKLRDFRNEFNELKNENEDLEAMLRITASNAFKLISNTMSSSGELIGALSYIVTAASEGMQAQIIGKKDDNNIVESHLNRALIFIKSIKKDKKLKEELNDQYKSISKNIDIINNSDNETLKNLCAKIRVEINDYLQK